MTPESGTEYRHSGIYVPRSTIRATRKEVLAEIWPEGVTPRLQESRWLQTKEYMNNFSMYFPDSSEGISLYERYFAEWGIMDRSLPQYLGQTGRAFLQTIRAVASYYKIDYDRIGRLRESYRKYPEEGESVLGEIGRMIFPVYVHLRALKYQHEYLAR